MTRRRSGWRSYVCGLYDDLVEAQAQRRDEYALGYQADEELFYARVESRVTFKQTLIMCRGWADRFGAGADAGRS
ncbi:hypothetical protein [Rhodococcoides fascians]|uniref:hypothetical protein n=1 Tax=Rhodococcoides fascians TaxID=1828 RepID=UPI000560FE0A|nr:hypothetical protein [Rhodococcus fascians]